LYAQYGHDSPRLPCGDPILAAVTQRGSTLAESGCRTQEKREWNIRNSVWTRKHPSMGAAFAIRAVRQTSVT
jgi:hypothetical protein